MDKRPNKDYADQIKRLRTKMGLTQINLAERLGVSFPTVNRWENAKSKPSQLSWNRLLELAGETNPDYQVAEPEPPPYGGTPPILDFAANPDIIRSLVEGERLSFGHLANPAFATEIASIDPLPHQRIAVYDHMLKQARLRLLEPEVMTTPEAFDQFPTEQRHHYFIRRTKEEMVGLDGNPLYPKRFSDTLGYALSQGDISEQRLYDETTEYLRYVYNRAKLLNQSAAR